MGYNHTESEMTGLNIMIASDIHGSEYYANKMIKAFESEKPDKLLLLGDILYHGPRNDLPKVYNPKAVINLLNPLKDKILCVRGNCDSEVDQMVLEFPIMADYIILESQGHTIYATHGHKYNTESPIAMANGDILLHGHTHVPAWEEFGDNNIYLNPGSVSIPKENSKHGYMIFSDNVFMWKNFDGEIYHTLNLK